MEICKTISCTGCFACKNICPKGAITVGYDRYDKSIPKVDESKCVNCGACMKVCPVNRPVEKRRAEYSVAVWSQNSQDQQLSSSGGAAAVFSRWILNNGGVVFGAASLDKTVKHIKVETEEELEKLRGSKYVQSDIGYTYREAREALKIGRMVLFTGTPCQIAGLKNFLGKDDDNLITVDLVCHGTPPVRYLQDHIAHAAPEKAWNRVSFRGRYDWLLTVFDNNEIVYQAPRECDSYFMAFLEGLTYRDNCYACSYACPERVSDITIGDFWGLDRKKLEHDYHGRISLVLPNTEKGKRFFEQCQDGLVWERRALEEALVPEQGNLLHPSIPHPDRETFLFHYPKLGFEGAMKKTNLWRVVKTVRIKQIMKGTFLYKAARKVLRKN